MRYVTLFFTLHVVLVSYLYTHFWFPIATTPPHLLESLRLSSCTSVLSLETGGTKCDSFASPTPQNCRLAFAYSAVSDLIVDSKEIMRNYQPDYRAEPLVELKTLEDVMGNLGYHFSNGIAGEYRVEDQSVFNKIVEIGRNGTSLIGGNGAIMALRAAQLGCKVGLAAPLSPAQIANIPASVHMLIPPVPTPDIHLVIEYQENQHWGGLVAPHSNRFYLNHDKYMLSLDFKDALHQQSLPEYDIFAIGGLHLMQNSAKSGEILDDIGKFIGRLKGEGKAIHFELADIKNEVFYKALLGQVVAQTDSLGFNEQELKTFVTFLAFGSLRFGWQSRPSVSDVIAETINAMRLSHEKGYNLTRVHAHSPLAHVLCSHSSHWDMPEIAVARGALLAGQLACNSTDIDSRLVMLTEEEVVLTKLSGEKQQTKRGESAVQCWAAAEDYQCCVALVPYCQVPKQTRALGDNISGAGLALHRRKKSS